MREHVSAMVDGELDEEQLASAIQMLEQDAELRQDWKVYHLIGDVMRGENVSSIDIGERLSARLDAEPALAVSVPHESKSPHQGRIAANRAWYSLAASLAGVAFVGWAAWQSMTPAATPDGAATASIASNGRPVAASEAQPVVYQSRVSDYWMAHRQLSGHMVDPQDQDVQFVSVDTSDRERQ